jgi:hypothetical protein
MPSKDLSSDKLEFFNSHNQLSVFEKKDFNKFIKKFNELIFQKRCAPQRLIEEIKIISREKFSLSLKIITENRIEVYAACDNYSVPVTLSEIQSESNSRGNTVKFEFD